MNSITAYLQRTIWLLGVILAGSVFGQAVSVVVTGNQISGTGTAVVSLNAVGTENTATFTLSWDPAVLSYVSATKGALIGTLTLNAAQKASGKLGVLAGLEPETTFPAGTNTLVTVTFTAVAPSTSTSIALIDGASPLPKKKVFDTQGGGLTATFTDATIAVSLPPSPPTVTTPTPATLTVVAGQNASFGVTLGGSPTPTVKWQKSTDAGTTWTDMVEGPRYIGVATTTLQIMGALSDDAGLYRGFATNSQGTASSTPAATLIVTPALSTTLAVASKALTLGVAATQFTPVTAAGGTPSYTYAVNPPLPAGLNLSVSTGAISGTSSAAVTATNYTITVTDSASATSQKTFSLTVNPAVVATQSVATTTLNAGTAATPFTPVTAAGGTAPLVFSITPLLPSGLAMNTATGVVSGNATGASSATTYTVMATDSLGASASQTFSLTVNGPFTTTQAMASNTLTRGTAATAFTPVTAGGGTTPYTFSVLPPLPSGLTLNTVTGAITGTPTAASAAATFTITVTDATAAPSSKTFSLTVNKTAQTITFGALADKTFGNAPFDVAATSDSGLAPVFSIVSGPATITGSTVTITGAGSVVVRAAQSGNADFAAATPADRTFTVAQASQVITFGTLADKTFGDAAFTVAATSDSGLAPVFSVVSGPATVAGSMVTLTGAGSVTIRAAQAGNTNFSAAANVDRTFAVAKANQLITFVQPDSKSLDLVSFQLVGTASSGLPLTYTTSNPSAGIVATVNGSTVALVSTGTITITASQPGDSNYNVATPVPQVLTVLNQSQAITFDAAQLAGKTFGNGPFTISATSNRGLTVNFISSDLTVATVGTSTIAAGVSSASVTIVGAGTASITAKQPGNPDTAAAIDRVQTLTVNKAAQVITFATLADKTFGNAAFDVAATSDSGLAPVFTVASGPATIAGSTVTLTGAGSVTIRAEQAGNGNYNAAAPVNRTFAVAKANQTITFPPVGSPKLIDAATFTLGATAAPSGLAVTYASSNPAVATVSGASVTVRGLGTTTLTAKQAGDANYNAAADATQILTVNPVAPVFVSAPAADVTTIQGGNFVYGPVALNPLSASPDRIFTLTGSPSVPTGLVVNPQTGVISGVPAVATTTPGVYTLTLTVGNGTLPSASRTINLTLKAPAPVITSPASASAVAGTAFTYTVTALPATGVTFTADGLPSGWTLTGATLTGTPTQAGVTTIVITATNGTGTAILPLVITATMPANAPAYVGSNNLSGTAGTAFSLTPNFGTGTGTTYVLSGTLPTGLTPAGNFASTGIISGTPTQTGSFPIVIAATRAGLTANAALTLTINPAGNAPIVSVTGGNVRSATVGTAITPIAFTTTPATATSFTIGTLPAGGSLPLGLTIGGTAAAPTIIGTPTTPGTTNVPISATDSSGRTGPVTTLVISVNPHAQAPMVTSAPVVLGQVLVPLATYTLAANPAAATYGMTGTLPAGLTFDPAAGTVTGTPAAGTMGSYQVYFAGTSANATIGTGLALEVTFNIAPQASAPVISSNGTAAAQVGQAFTYQIAASGNPNLYSASPLPAYGLTLNTATGMISGVPTAATGATPFNITLTATNGSVTSNPKVLALTIMPAPATPVITSAASATGRVGSAFTYQATASETPTSFVVMDLAPGLVVNPLSGAITGTPTQSGTFTASLRAANTAGLGAATPFVITVASAPSAPRITSEATVVGQVGVATFTYQIRLKDGSGTDVALPIPAGYSFASTGTLPGGLALNTSTGLISGSPTEPGAFSISLTATGEGGTSVPQGLSITINPAANVPLITSAGRVTGNVGLPFNYQITATNPPHVTLEAVNLPAGLAVNPFTGLIQGTPTAVATTVASLVGTNAAGTGPSRDVTIVIEPATTAPVISGADQVAAQVGANFTYQITATGTPTSYEVVGAPAWMTLNTNTGAIAGTPTAPATLAVLLLATNSAGTSAPKLFVITIAPAVNTPVLTSSRTASGTVGTAFTTYTLAAAPAATSFVATGLPPGLSLVFTLPNNWVITGTPTASGVYPVSVFASNANGVGAPGTVVITIAANITFGQ